MPKATKLPSGNWRVQVYSHTDAQGKKHKKSFTAPTKKEALLAAAQFSADNKIKYAVQDMTLETAYKQYINNKSAILSPSTLLGYKRVSKNYLQPLMSKKLSNITSADVQFCINSEASKLSPKSIRNIYGLFTAVMAEFAPEMKFNCKLPQKQKHEMYIPTNEEIARIFEACKNTEIEVPIKLAACLGLRISEILGLKWKAVDLKQKRITIDVARVIGEQGVSEKTPKTVAGYRTLTLPDELVQLLINVKETSKNEYVTQLNGNQIYKKHIHILSQLGIPHFRFHDYRHYYASVLLSLGIPNKYAQNRMGHASDYMLKNVYQHLMKEKKGAVDEQIDSFMTTLLSKQ